MPKGSTKSAARSGFDQLQEPALIVLRKHLEASTGVPEHSVTLPAFHDADGAETVSEQQGSVTLSGSGAPGSGCQLSRSLLTRVSGYYQHAASFGTPPAHISLDFGHRAVALLADALNSGSMQLGPATVVHLLQAASYLQVAAALDAAAQYLQDHLLDSFPGPVLRVALDLHLTGLQRHIEQDFQQRFFMLSGDKAAALLREWPPAKRRQLLASPQLCAPTELCLVETLCRLAKAASSAEAVQLLDCVRYGAMSAHEVAAAALYLQHNAKWVDKRLSTALAWRLLNARVAADLEADGVPLAPATAGLGAQRRQQQQGTGGGSIAAGGAPCGAAAGGCLAAAAAAAGQPQARAARQRSLHWGLRTAALAEWSGTTMYCTQAAVACSWGPPQPMVLQLEREDPRHAAQEAVSGTSGSGTATTSGGTGWDLQLSLEPHSFPAGFRATCFAFGTSGLFWCPLGPLAKPGPCWWKVGFLSSQLPRALPLAPALAVAAASGGGLQLGAVSGGEGGLLLVGWWVPEQ